MRKIGVIGLDGSGKTTYLMAMAESLKRGVCELSFSILQKDARSALEQRWNNMTHGFWPAGTCLSQEYIFQCSKSGYIYPKLDFQWIDYRGGILFSCDEDDCSEREDLLNYLRNSDGVVVLIGADNIKRILTNTANFYDFDFRYLILSIGERLKEIPITIVITKSDLLNNQEKALLFPLVKELLPFVFNTNCQIKALIVPVCVGHTFIDNDGNIGGVIYNNPSDGNVHIPVLFNLCHILDNQIKASNSFKDIADMTTIKNKIKKELVTLANNNIIEINAI